MYFPSLTLSLCALAQLASASPMAAQALNTEVSRPSDSNARNAEFATAKCHNWVHHSSHRKLNWFQVWGASHWNAENDAKTAMGAFHKSLADRLGDKLLSFSWSIDTMSNTYFAMIHVHDMPKWGEDITGRPQANTMEQAILDGGGPAIQCKREKMKVGSFWEDDNDTPWLARRFPKPFKWVYQFEWTTDRSIVLAQPDPIEAMYLGPICIGVDGVGKGCPGCDEQDPDKRYQICQKE